MSIRMPSKSGSSAGGPRVLTKKDVTDLEAAGVKLRRQMDVHVTCLDARSTSKVEVVQEWHEYLKKRAEIELEYTKSLDKLSDRTIEKISRLKKSSKENSLNGCSSTPIDLLLTMVTDNKQLASRRGLLCDDITNEVLPRLDVVSKDISISTRRVKEGFHVAHEEIKKAHTDLLESMKAYMAACVASEESQSKLSKIQSSRSKGKNVDKDAKKEIKMLEGLMSNKFKAITCRNEYIMCLEWFNKICRTYFKRWSADLLEFFDFDFHNSIRNVQRLHGSLEKNYLALNTQFIDSWQKQLSELSAKADLRKFQAANMGAFPIPQDVPFVPYGPNEKHSLYAVSGVYEGMASQRGDLTMQIGQTTFRLDEAHRSLQEVKESFLKSQETVFGSSIEECLEENGMLSRTLLLCVSVQQCQAAAPWSDCSLCNVKEVCSMYIMMLLKCLHTSSGGRLGFL
ncbi:SLIT-ROBO Rho GTPase-activating protein 2B-like [Sycon ciliatum]|uniref:SLIT-ROBO Rho GTPase-activating protein 2B-like n=1 Tax=Sycon ciliatum TaxID=27933 RepID=UPI0031F6DE77